MASYDHLNFFGQWLLLNNFGELLISLCSVTHLYFQTSVHTNNALNTKLSDNHYKCIIWFNTPKSSWYVCFYDHLSMRNLRHWIVDRPGGLPWLSPKVTNVEVIREFHSRNLWISSTEESLRRKTNEVPAPYALIHFLKSHHQQPWRRLILDEFPIRTWTSQWAKDIEHMTWAKGFMIIRLPSSVFHVLVRFGIRRGSSTQPQNRRDAPSFSVLS